MAWREITEADVQGVMSQPELAAYQAAAIAVDQDPMQDAILGVVGQCRGYIADNPANALADGNTLPERVILSALHIIRVELLTRVDVEVSKDRQSAKSDAIRFFERVSEGKVAVEQPTGALDNTGSNASSVETLNSRPQITGRSKLSGL